MFDILAALALIKRKNASGAASIRVYINTLKEPTETPLELLCKFPKETCDDDAVRSEIEQLSAEEEEHWALEICLCGVPPLVTHSVLLRDYSTLVCRVLRGYIESNKLDKQTRHAYSEYFHKNKAQFDAVCTVVQFDQLKLVIKGLPHKHKRLFIKSCLLIINQTSLF